MDLAHAQTAIAAQQLRMGELAFRPPPPLPTTCCGKGCTGCVWQGYFDAVAFWLEDAQALLRQP